MTVLLQERLSSQSVALSSRVDGLEEELQEVRIIKEGLSTYIRQLEQANDDLERSKRSVTLKYVVYCHRGVDRS